MKPGPRSGHDLSLIVKIDAGVSIQQVQSATHDIVVNNSKASQAEVHLKNEATIPNKDFILTYAVAGNDIHDAVLDLSRLIFCHSCKVYVAIYFLGHSRNLLSGIHPVVLFQMDTRHKPQV